MTALTKLRNKSEEGFTLVEILVVILIIGILAAVAIPVFLNQRQTATDAAVESDVKNIALVLDTYITDNPNASTFDATWVRNNSKKSNGTVISVTGVPNDYCVYGRHPNGKKYLSTATWEEAGNKRPYFLYVKNVGGASIIETQGVSTQSCSSYNVGFTV